MLLQDTKLFVGHRTVSAAYLGDTKVWPITPDVPAVRGLLLSFDTFPFTDARENPLDIVGNIFQETTGLFGTSGGLGIGGGSIRPMVSLDPKDIGTWTFETWIRTYNNAGTGNADANLVTWEGVINNVHRYFKIYFKGGSELILDSNDYDLNFGKSWADCNAGVRIAASCSGGNLKIYFNGNKVDELSGFGSGPTNNVGVITIGNDASSTSPLQDVDIDELRWTPDAGLYTGDSYALATAPFTDAAPSDPHYSDVALLLPLDGTYNDAKGHKAVVEGSVYLNSVADGPFNKQYAVFRSGSGRISFPASTDWDLGKYFTIEFHIRFDGYNPKEGCIISNGWDHATSDLYAPYLVYQPPSKDGVMFFSSTDSSKGWDACNSLGNVADGQPPLHKWAHVAIVSARQGVASRKFHIYVDGVPLYSDLKDIDALDYTPSTYPLTIGNGRNNNSSTVMSICNIRLTRNVARYTAKFTPPTEPYPTR